MNPEPSRPRASRLCFAATLAVLLVGVVPLPRSWVGGRTLLGSARSPELNRSDREANAAGYYEGLIGAGGSEGSCGELALRLLGKPTDMIRFHAANVNRQLRHDFLQFELKPNVNKTLFGRPFVTNAQGFRDDERSVGKPLGTFRVAVLGSSIDMGWGVSMEETYVKRLERWLNARAEKRGLARRFEVLNFAVAAYSPLQRLECYRRKAAAYQPDLVLYSATMLDTRLLEIHICDMFQDMVTDFRYDFVRRAIADADITADDLERDASGRLIHKHRIKAKVQRHHWALYDATLAALAAECRSEGVPLACLIIPRVGKADAPDARAGSVARLRGIAAHHAVTLFDLSHAFDHTDPARLEIASWDDHPNALGHERLFLTLARDLVNDPILNTTLFPPESRP